MVEIRSNDDGGMAKGDESLRMSRFKKTTKEMIMMKKKN